MIGHLVRAYHDKRSAEMHADLDVVFMEQLTRIEDKWCPRVRAMRQEEIEDVLDQELVELCQTMTPPAHNREGECHFEYEVIPTEHLLSLCEFEYRRS
jgi:hypothetical protein